VHPEASRCPFLQESLVQFCAASARPTYVPWSESPDLRCAHDGHRFCELFLAVAGAAARGPALPTADPDEAGTAVVDGVPVPGWLFYADNHMWLDAGDDGLCHLGVDAFLTRLVGEVERLTFLTVKGNGRPAVVLTVGGVDHTLVFARHLSLVAANTRLRSGLDRLVADPYGLGWLFTARWDDDAGALRHGRAAREWMASEVGRLSRVVHEHLLHPRAGAALPADGGRPAPGFLRHLEREDVLRLFAAFFPLPVETRRAP
jgi:glycine cleavage system H lipoate-binding protein